MFSLLLWIAAARPWEGQSQASLPVLNLGHDQFLWLGRRWELNWLWESLAVALSSHPCLGGCRTSLRAPEAAEATILPFPTQSTAQLRGRWAQATKL